MVAVNKIYLGTGITVIPILFTLRIRFIRIRRCETPIIIFFTSNELLEIVDLKEQYPYSLMPKGAN